MSPEEYLRRNLGSGATSLSWLLPLLYVLLALTLVAWAGARHSNRTRRGRALFVFTIGIALIVLASAFFLLRAVGNTRFVGVGAAATLLGCAMLVVASGSLLPSVEDWFGARRELRIIQPLLEELHRRHPNIGIGVRPRGPLLFRVAEQMSLISDALYLEATRALESDEGGAIDESSDPVRSSVEPDDQAVRIAQWIHAGRGADRDAANALFPGPNWLRQPSSYSDREWILAIADQYRTLSRSVDVAAA
jgi:4-amino-4-deoxy-L-arabinose transferase-like glycosyltransferase